MNSLKSIPSSRVIRWTAAEASWRICWRGNLESLLERQSGSYELQPSFTSSERQITALWYTTCSYARYKMDAVICMSTWKLYICLIHITNYMYYDLWYIWWFTCCTNISGSLEIRKNLRKQICYLPVIKIVAYTVWHCYNMVLKITLHWDRTQISFFFLSQKISHTLSPRVIYGMSLMRITSTKMTIL